MGVVSLLRRPELAPPLGLRGYRRLARIYSEASCVAGYQDLLRSTALGTPVGKAERKRAAA